MLFKQQGLGSKNATRHWLFRYGLALTIFAATIGLSLLLNYLTVKINLTIPVVLALVAAAWYGGRGPGLLISILFEATTIIYTPIPPDSNAAKAAFGYFSVFSLYVFLIWMLTGLKRTRDALRTREMQQAAVARFGQDALSRIPLKLLLPNAGELVRKTLAVDFSAICELTPAKDVLCYTAGAGWAEDVVGFEFDYGTERSLAGRVLRTGEPVVVTDLDRDERIEGSAMLKQNGVRSAIGVKILHREEAYGVLGAFATVPRAFSIDDINFLQSIANIIAEAAGRLNAEDEIREQRSWLQTTLSSIGDGVIATDRDGAVTFLNPVAETLTGWTDAEARARSLDDIFYIINEQTRERVPTPVAKVIETGIVVGLANHTVLVSRQGKEIPIDDSAAPIKEGGEIKGVVLVFSDVTERKMVERSRRETEIMHRLVEAQEAERHRIARDLHDHLGQKMTALRLQIESLTDRRAGGTSIAHAIDELKVAALHIDRDIGFLSWELRPTELENLGLDDALRSFVREWSSQYGINAEFHTSKIEKGAPIGRLAQSLETNLYRIAQEALNNVLKHADAKQVNVLLQHREKNIVLIVEDNGLGFKRDPESGNGKKPGGLGLVGMQERAALMSGTLEIDTKPGGGTTILARIPVG